MFNNISDGKNWSAAVIYRLLCTVYSQTIVNEGVVDQRISFFLNGRTNIQNDKRSGKPSGVGDEFV